MKPLQTYDKKMCASCKWACRAHVGMAGANAVARGEKTTSLIYCDYGIRTGNSCLIRKKDGSVSDRRGKDKSNCKLYEKR